MNGQTVLPPMLECCDIGVQIGNSRVVQNCDLAAAAGEFIILAGPNGAGKTSLLRALANALPYSGKAYFKGRDLKKIGRNDRARAIAYLPQNGQIHWPMMVRDIVALGQMPFSNGPSETTTAGAVTIDEAVKRCDIEHLLDRLATTLSGGERARVLLARAMATGANILLVDEPLASLDPRHQLATMHTLKEYAEDGRTVVAVLHDIGLGLRFSKRFILMNHGMIAANGPGEQLFEAGVFDKIFAVHFEKLTGENSTFAGISATESMIFDPKQR